MILTPERIIVGKILSLHGINGLVKLKSFTEKKKNIFNLYNYYIKNKKIEKITLYFKSKEMFICRINDFKSREETEIFVNKEIYVGVDSLPKLEDKEYYQHDLIGFEVENKNGDFFGKVIRFHDFGAGVVIEVIKNKKTLFLPMDQKFVKNINLELKKITLDLSIESMAE